MKDSSAPPKGPSSFPWEFSPWIYAFGSALLAALFHLPGLKNGFVGWDDPEVVVNNPHIHLLDPSFFQWAFTSFRHQNWMPLTWLSYAIDYAVGGNQPGIYHFTAILFHAINTALVFYLCLRILQVSRQKAEAAGAVGWGIPPIPVAFLAAVLFGLHPLQVESVAWVSERNNLLFVLFYLWALLSYLDYASSAQPGKGKLYRCLALFLLALMSKAIAVTLPLAMLILDAWPLRRLQGRLGRMVWEKTAFFAASVLAGVMAIFAQASGKAFEMTEGFPFYFRVLNAFRSLALYLWKILWPVDLCPLYPFPHVRDAAYFAGDAAAAGVVLLVTAVCFFLWKKKPYLGAAWLFYLVVLLPVLGVLQVGSQAAADRYVYLPCVGLFLVFSAWFAAVTRGKQSIFLAGGAALVVLLGIVTVHQTGVWGNTVTLWETVVERYPTDSPAFTHSNLAAGYSLNGRLEDALREYDAAIALSSPAPEAHNGKGTILFDLGKKEEAIQEFKTAIALDPYYAGPHRNLARAYHLMGMDKEAQEEMGLAQSLENRDGQ